jgi:hypothetical protein
MSTCTFHIYFPICPKLTIVDRHVMLLSVHEFHENRCREVRASLMGLKEITFAVYALKPCDMLRANNALLKSVCCIMV